MSNDLGNVKLKEEKKEIDPSKTNKHIKSILSDILFPEKTLQGQLKYLSKKLKPDALEGLLLDKSGKKKLGVSALETKVLWAYRHAVKQNVDGLNKITGLQKKVIEESVKVQKEKIKVINKEVKNLKIVQNNTKKDRPTLNNAFSKPQRKKNYSPSAWLTNNFMGKASNQGFYSNENTFIKSDGSVDFDRLKNTPISKHKDIGSVHNRAFWKPLRHELNPFTVMTKEQYQNNTQIDFNKLKDTPISKFKNIGGIHNGKFFNIGGMNIVPNKLQSSLMGASSQNFINPFPTIKKINALRQANSSFNFSSPGLINIGGKTSSLTNFVQGLKSNNNQSATNTATKKKRTKSTNKNDCCNRLIKVLNGIHKASYMNNALLNGIYKSTLRMGGQQNQQNPNTTNNSWFSNLFGTGNNQNSQHSQNTQRINNRRNNKNGFWNLLKSIIRPLGRKKRNSPISNAGRAVGQGGMGLLGALPGALVGAALPLLISAIAGYFVAGDSIGGVPAAILGGLTPFLPSLLGLGGAGIATKLAKKGFGVTSKVVGGAGKGLSWVGRKTFGGKSIKTRSTIGAKAGAWVAKAGGLLAWRGGKSVLKAGAKGGKGLLKGLGSIMGRIPGLGMGIRMIPGIGTAINIGLGAAGLGMGIYDAWNTTTNTKDFLKEAGWNTLGNLGSIATAGMVDADTIKNAGKGALDTLMATDLYRKAKKTVEESYAYDLIFNPPTYKKRFEKKAQEYIKKGGTAEDFIAHSTQLMTKYSLPLKMPETMNKVRASVSDNMKELKLGASNFTSVSADSYNKATTTMNNNSNVVNVYNEPAQNNVTLLNALGGLYADPRYF